MSFKYHGDIIKKNCGWCEIIEVESCYYQSDFSMSKILGKLSDYNDILNRQIQAIKITINERLLSSSNIRATARYYQLTSTSAKINTPEK